VLAAGSKASGARSQERALGALRFSLTKDLHGCRSVAGKANRHDLPSLVALGVRNSEMQQLTDDKQSATSTGHGSKMDRNKAANVAEELAI
jgi:hypothetical protein